ncbi:cytochrome c biogenesis protein CcsA [Prosthecochloris sp. N3]|uniref:Cytochrome c biogenesis protein CcsA n=1 Tax=Prosthecochloris ethylica TaxID=2743976 RepID=A0ABR9XQY1_9CHLB|nr:MULTISPECIES: cytochrome c biogenesis protein CcsA [Prosthecochloris]MEC9486799.1 cytochrome c biogenesis protein CcsA [Prosthecochloris sp.]MBF0585543.1 cytochrome c biogenesis protein CcsA [Prosthecochloris ethylica]MBF0636329.1 cytochrome c biogenesis protein CcsA [Prosthecochloris ethylica]NUK46773.1 cytochrome c biogenesis protein CcsA [Prosthecochloris ethylica]RNA64647.1 cytochrome C biogenesis protein [Prosthecochloris sp. ZM_2]
MLLLITFAVSLLYIITTALYGADFFRRNEIASTYKQPALIVTIVAHATFIGMLTAPSGYQLGYSSYTIMSMVALTLAVIYMFIEFSTKTDKTGFFVLSFSTGAEILSSLLFSLAPDQGESFSGLGIGIHLFSATFSFSSIAIAGLYSILYLLLFSEIKNNRFGMLFENLPNLEVLEQLIKHAVAFGFLFLTLTILAGVIGSAHSGEQINLLDPKLIALVIIWLLYGASLFIKKLFGWDTKHMAYLLIGLFVFITLLILLMSLFSPTFHNISFSGSVI